MDDIELIQAFNDCTCDADDISKCTCDFNPEGIEA